MTKQLKQQITNQGVAQYAGLETYCTLTTSSGDEYHVEVVMKDKFGRIKKVLNKVSNERPETTNNGFVNLQSIDFDGVDDRLITNTDSVASKRSYSFWAKSSQTGDNRGVFGHGDQKRGGFHFNFTTSNRNLLYLNLEYYVYWVESTKSDDNAWHHWVIYVDPTDISKCQAYCDGQLQEKYHTSSSSGSALAYTEPITIGATQQSSGHAYQGKLDEFAIFDGELTLLEVQSIYNSGVPTDLTINTGNYVSADNLVAYYRFDNTAFPNSNSVIGNATGVMTNMQENDITFDTP